MPFGGWLLRSVSMFWRCLTPVSSFWLRSSTYERRLSSTRDALISWPYKNLQVGKKGRLLTDADGKANKNFKSRKEQVVQKMRSATSPRPVVHIISSKANATETAGPTGERDRATSGLSCGVAPAMTHI